MNMPPPVAAAGTSPTTPPDGEPFRFMDLPFDVRYLIYPLAMEPEKRSKKYDQTAHYDIIFENRTDVNNVLPSILNVSTKLRIEEFQSFVQHSILDLEDAMGMPWLAPNLFFDKVNAYITKHRLDFDFLANVSVARIMVVGASGSIPHGLGLVLRCPRLSELIIDFETPSDEHSSSDMSTMFDGDLRGHEAIFRSSVHTVTVRWPKRRQFSGVVYLKLLQELAYACGFVEAPWMRSEKYPELEPVDEDTEGNKFYAIKIKRETVIMDADKEVRVCPRIVLLC